MEKNQPMIFCCYLLEMWTGLQACAILVCLLNDSTDQGSPWLLLLQCKPLHWVWRRTTTADEASPRVEPARSRITGEAEDSTVYKTLLHWHGLARGADAPPPQGEDMLARTPPPTPPLTPLLPDIVIEIKTSNTVKQKGKYHSRVYVLKHEDGRKKSNEWNELCQYMKARGLSGLLCQLIPLVIFQSDSI